MATDLQGEGLAAGGGGGYGHWTLGSRTLDIGQLDIGLPGHWTLDILLWTLTFGIWTFGHNEFWAHPMDPWDMEPNTPVEVDTGPGKGSHSVSYGRWANQRTPPP